MATRISGSNATKGARASARKRAGRLAEPRQTLTDIAYRQIEEAIVTLRIAPGTPVSEQGLVEMTGIGRTPIREAIQRLAREHLVFVLPQRGLLIAQVDVSKQLKLLELRREIERLICRSAARRANPEECGEFSRLAEEFRSSASKNESVAFIRADRDFNELCMAAARNEFAEGAMRMIHGLSRRFWYLHYRQSSDMPEMAHLHAEIAVAISSKNVKNAGDSLDRLIDFIEKYTRATLESD
ncbi:MAG: GntR family transcriptional regulator [Dehalococcoidia bacterium]